jgi:hypothetical protein
VYWKPTKTIKSGSLVKLYNLYRIYYGDDGKPGTRQPPAIIGMYIETGWGGQFEFYKIAVLKDEDGCGGFVQNYLTSDFSMVPLTKEEEEEYGR